jgi:hypothetical protein
MAPHPQPGTVSGSDAGRTCPYCRVPLKAGIPMVRCGDCATPHHADCWSGHGGCAVVACAGAPAQHAASHQVPPDAPRPASPPPVIPMPTPAPAPIATPAARAWRPRAVAAAVAIALAVGGSAVALVSRGDDDGGATDTVFVDQTTGDSSDPASPEPASDGAVVPVSDEATRQAIQDVLYEHHMDVVNGDYRAAWDLLSARKQAQKLREDGFRKWAAAQATLTPYLDPSDMYVTIEALDADTGVARVYVSGMTWSKPGARCSEWSGITWIKYEDGAWRYDPGYSTTPERERRWKPRLPELLGASC